MSTGSGGVSVRAGAGPSFGKRPRRLPRKQLARHRGGGTEPESRQLGHALVCGECGQLGWPTDVGAAQPHRRDTVEDVGYREPCSHCGERSWIDLGRESTALMLRQHDEHDVEARAPGHARVVRYGLIGAVVGALMGAAILGSVGGMVVLSGLSTLLGGAWAVRRQRALAPPPSRLPARWTMALAPEGPACEVVVGPARALGELLTAPLSARRCVAYEVGLRHDADAGAPASTWALLEQRVAPLEVDAARVDPQAVHLALERQRLGHRSTVELDEAANAFLRQRGFGSGSLELELFETILEPGATVQLELAAQGATLRRGSAALVHVGGDR